MTEKEFKKLNYKVVLVESGQPNAFSKKVDINIQNNDTIYLSVYNNPNLYRLLTKAIDKYFK